MINTTIYDNIPESLRNLDVPIFVLFKVEQLEDGTYKKVPYQPNGYKASSKDTDTWCTFAEAVAAHKTGEYECIGIALVAQLTCIDLDQLRNADTGELHPIAQDIITRVPGWSESSVSGNGIHIFGYCASDFEHTKHTWIEAGVKRAVEIYQYPHFIALTGNKLDSSADDLDDVNGLTDQITSVYEQYIAPHYAASDKVASTASVVSTDDIDIDERLETAYRSHSGPAIKRLMAGDMTEYANDHSAADLALCCHLAFWLGRDANLIRQAFERSALANRDKWQKRTDYRHRTITSAIANTTQVYSAEPQHTDADMVMDRLRQVAKPRQSPGITPRPTRRDDIDRAMEMLMGARLTNMDIPPVEYWDEPFFPRQSIIAVTGEAAHGKSTFVVRRLIDIMHNHSDVMGIYCDADNPAAIAKERMQRLLGGLEDRISYWGGFSFDADGKSLPPWQIEDIRWMVLIERAVAAGKYPIIVFDTLNSFMNGQNENDNAVVGRLMVAMRNMTHAGATVVIIHHTGKSATSKESRGASSFKGGVDSGWLVDSTIVDCTITSMSVTAWKSRLGKTAPYMFHINEDGQLIQNNKSDACEMIYKFVQENPGLSANGLEKQAKTNNKMFSREMLRKAITNGVASQRLRIEGGKYYMNEEKNNAN